ncbi:MAG: serine hydrolase [Reyranellales bacterium]
MTLFLKRCAANLCGFAICIFVAAILAPFAADAQSTSVKMRAAPPAKMRTTARSPIRTPSPWAPNPGANSKDSYLIVDAVSGRELASDRPDELRHPASLTKLMTLYLTFSALDSGRLSLADGLSVSSNALNAQPTKMGLTPGGAVTVRDAIMGLVTRSANDAAIVLGEALGGSEESFAQQMTLKARQLGMSSTVFRNASGLPNHEQVTTARDMAKLAHALLRDFPHYYPVFSVQSYFYRGRPLENHNRMLASYAGADGLKTGYTAASGFNLVMSAVRDNHRLIGVVMGGDTAFQRDRLMADLMDRGFVSAQAMGLAAWTAPRRPPSARYSAINFAPGTSLPDPPAVSQIARVEPAAAVPPPVAARLAAAAPASAPDPGGPSIGSWVIQVGSFGDSRAAQLALERASSALPNTIRSHGAATVDEVQMAQKTFHRARLTNLSQEEAIDGCKRLEQRKIYCSALQVTAWNTPGAR